MSVVTIVVSECSFGSRRLNINRETNMDARLAIVSAFLGILDFNYVLTCSSSWLKCPV